jgi:hypothetical protein
MSLPAIPHRAYLIKLLEVSTMNRVFKSGVFTILVVLFLAVSTVSFSTDGSGKSDGKGKLVVAFLDVSGPSSGGTKENVYRGDYVTITARLKRDGGTKSSPLKVRFYLSSDRDGTDMKHEFDIFHDVSLNKSGSVSVTGRYVIPYSIAAGDSYWVVVEVNPEEIIESGENKTKITSGINVPCDPFLSYDHCSDPD